MSLIDPNIFRLPYLLLCNDILNDRSYEYETHYLKSSHDLVFGAKIQEWKIMTQILEYCCGEIILSSIVICYGIKFLRNIRFASYLQKPTYLSIYGF